MTDQGQYYRQRMEAELDAAEQAEDATVAAVHRSLADRYRQMIEDGGDEAQQPLTA